MNAGHLRCCSCSRTALIANIALLCEQAGALCLANWHSGRTGSQQTASQLPGSFLQRGTSEFSDWAPPKKKSSDYTFGLSSIILALCRYNVTGMSYIYIFIEIGQSMRCNCRTVVH